MWAAQRPRDSDGEHESNARTLHEGEVDDLVQRLHSSKQFHEHAMRKTQNEALGQELRELSFTPQLNSNSLSMEKRKRGNKKMVDMQSAMLQVCARLPRERAASARARRRRREGFADRPRRLTADGRARALIVWCPQKRADELKAAQEAKKEEELAGCTFQPNLLAAGRSDKMLRESGRADNRSTDDIIRYQEEAKVRHRSTPHS